MSNQQKPILSTRLQNLPVSATRKLLPYAQEAKKNGIKIYHLNVGDPDIPTPEVMLDVLKNWKYNPIRYTPSQGELKLIEALLSYYHTLGYEYVKKENLIVTLGGSEAVAMSLFATTDPGDEVLVFEPFYSGYLPPSFIHTIKLVPVPTKINNGFHLPSKKIIESHITSKTRAILFCNPANPTGTVYTKEELTLLVTIAKEHNLFLISDEVYREFVFVDRKIVSLLDFMEEIPERAIVVDSLSKRYSLCGARLGTFISRNPTIMTGVIKMSQARLSGGFIDQTMAEKLTEVPLSYTKKIQEEYRQRRDFLFTELSKINGVVIAKPEGAFYCMVQLPVKNAEEFCIWLLSKYRNKNETIMFAPGAGFYLTPGKGINEIRIAYILNIPQLRRCIELLKDALDTYSLEYESNKNS